MSIPGQGDHEGGHADQSDEHSPARRRSPRLLRSPRVRSGSG
jgi:hypothetical protein